MLNEIKLLTRLHLLNAFGRNEAKYSADKKKRRNMRAMLFVYILLGCMIVFYTSLLSLLFSALGAPEIVPVFLFFIASVLIFIFSVFKTATAVFNVRYFEREIVLPVQPADIVISRFLTMYSFNVLLTAVILIPGSLISIAFAHAGAGFYLMTAGALFLTPLIPMTAATALGALVLAVSSRMRHRNIAAVILSLILMVGFLVLMLSISFGSGSISSDEILRLSTAVISQASSLYPVAGLYAAGITGGSFASYAVFAGMSLGIFAVFFAAVSRGYLRLCSALNTAPAGKNYVMQRQTTAPQVLALYKKELKRYVSSSVYVMNTVAGYVIMLVFAVLVLVMGEDTINGFFGMDGFLQTAAPLVMALICAISSTTACSVSMEGKHWWIVQSAPVSAKKIFDSKILVNLTVAFPFYAVSVILLAASIQMSAAGCLLLIILPVVYILFTAVLGLFVNLRLPMMEWESEVRVVKQSGSVMITMLAGIAAAGIPFALSFIVPEPAKTLMLFLVCAGVLAATAVLYRKNTRTRLTEI